MIRVNKIMALLMHEKLRILFQILDLLQIIQEYSVLEDYGHVEGIDVLNQKFQVQFITITSFFLTGLKWDLARKQLTL